MPLYFYLRDSRTKPVAPSVHQRCFSESRRGPVNTVKTAASEPVIRNFYQVVPGDTQKISEVRARVKQSHILIFNDTGAKRRFRSHPMKEICHGKKNSHL